MKHTAIPDADGYQWGVRFQDGSVVRRWNGRTQQDRAQEYIYIWRWIWGDYNSITLVRRLVADGRGAPWEHVDIDPWHRPTSGRAFSHQGVCLRGWWRARISFRQAEGLRRRYAGAGRQQ